MLARQGNLYHFRRVVPARLRSIIGRSEIWCSLGTSNPTHARAKAGVVYAAVERYFAVVDEAIQLQPSPEEEERAILRAIADEATQLAEVQRSIAEAQQRTADLRLVMEEARHAKELAAVVKRLTSQGIAAARQGLAQAERERREREKAQAVAAEARNHGERMQAATESLGAVAEMVKANIKPPGPLASTLLAGHWLRRATIHRATEQVLSQERTTLRFFLETCGDRSVETYDRGDVTRFLNQLRRLPKVYGRKPTDAQLSMEQLIARADTEGGKRVSDKTVKRVASVNVVENADGLEAAMAQAALGGSCRVSLVGGGLSISPMASTPM